MEALMFSYEDLSHLTGLSKAVLHQRVSSGTLPTDDPEKHKGALRSFSLSDAMRACVIAELTRFGVNYAAAGDLVKYLVCCEQGFVTNLTTGNWGEMLIVSAELCERDSAPANRQPVRYAVDVKHDHKIMRLIKKPDMGAHIIMNVSAIVAKLISLKGEK
jgi:hypothetical protein